MKEYGLNDSQLGVYLDMIEDPMTIKYNLPVLITLPDGVDRDRVWQAFADTVAAHPIYAATFAAGEEGPVMRIPDGTLRVSPCAEEDFLKPFDLEKGPLVRAAIIDAGLKFEMHHLVFDGTSQMNFCAELAARYNGQPLPVEELTIFDKAAADARVKTTPAFASA